MDEKIITLVRNIIKENETLIESQVKKLQFKRKFALELEHGIEKSGQRIFVISGLRGTGKTSALYQEFANTTAGKIYVSCDELHARQVSILDLLESLDFIHANKVGLESEFFLFLDEVTYLKQWALELKIIRDKRPHLFIIATSSSALQLKAVTELSRRVYEIFAYPLSFREYLLIKHGVEITDELSKRIKSKIGGNLEVEYSEVLKLTAAKNLFGIYDEYTHFDLPFCINLDSNAYSKAVKGLIKSTIYEDFARYESFETSLIPVAEKTLTYLSTVPSDGVKIVTLAELFNVSKESVSKILETLQKALVIKGVEHTGRNKGIKRPKKWFFYSASMREILASPTIPMQTIAGNSREDIVFLHLSQFGLEIKYSHEVDFEIGNLKIEVGSKSKKQKDELITLGTEDKLNFNYVPIPLFLLAV